MAKINKHTAWLKWSIAKELEIDDGFERAEAYEAKHNIVNSEPRPRIERYRRDIYIRRSNYTTVYKLRKPLVKFQWPLRWPIKIWLVKRNLYDRKDF